MHSPPAATHDAAGSSRGEATIPPATPLPPPLALPPLAQVERDTIARRYAHAGHVLHARWKLAHDPVYAATSSRLADPTLPLLDIGCGLGLLGHYLQARDRLHRYIGLDHDARKIGAAQAAVRRAGLQQRMHLSADDVSLLPSVQGNVALLDVLHYLSAPRQQALLSAAVMHLAPTGQLIIRSVLREPNWRFHATRVEEFFLRYSGWIPGGAQHYPSADELRTPLESAGLVVQIESLRGRTPYNSYLITAQRRV